ncbi:MAG: hypothetical protein EXR72_17875 [Myxococcales bacterium]|nr:hypothetical protein [Myxococcales bacterium]
MSCSAPAVEESQDYAATSPLPAVTTWSPGMDLWPSAKPPLTALLVIGKAPLADHNRIYGLDMRSGVVTLHRDALTLDVPNLADINLHEIGNNDPAGQGSTGVVKGPFVCCRGDEVKFVANLQILGTQILGASNKYQAAQAALK